MMLVPAISFPSCFGMLPWRKETAGGPAIGLPLSSHPADPGRIASIDTIKAIAVFAVICIHCMPFHGRLHTLNGVINQLCRFSVPFFFLASGYLFARHLKRSRDPGRFRKQLARLVILYVSWCMFYLLIPSPRLVADHGLLKGIYLSASALVSGGDFKLLFEGTSYHLWFFASLISAFLILYPFRDPQRWAVLMLAAASLYVFGLLAGSYSSTWLGLKMSFNTRNGPFFSTLFVSIGYMVGSTDYRIPARAACALTLAGVAVHMTEVFLLQSVFGIPLARHEFLLGTVLTGCGLMLLATANPDLGRGSLLARCGKYALGIYGMHVVAVTALRRSVDLHNLAWHPVLPVFAFLITLSLVLIAARLPVIKHLVT